MGKLSIEELRLLHDRELGQSKQKEAKVILANRTKAASFIRLVLARAYMQNTKATFHQWSIIPCRTNEGNVGFLDIANGTAWDSTVVCIPEVDDLGYGDEDAAYAGANNIAASAKIFTGEAQVDKLKTVDHSGKREVFIVSVGDENYPDLKDETPLPPSMPKGWRQICLPTWRGYEGDGHCLVPESLFTFEQLVRPKLVQHGLKTCYGTRGRPLRVLNDYVRNWPTGTTSLPDWLTYDSEPTDPSWWPFREGQKPKVIEAVWNWYRQAAEQLSKHFDNSDAIMIAWAAFFAAKKENKWSSIKIDEFSRPYRHSKYWSGQTDQEKRNDNIVWRMNHCIEKFLGDYLTETHLYTPQRWYYDNAESVGREGPYWYVKHLLWRVVEKKIEPLVLQLGFLSGSSQSDSDNKHLELAITGLAKATVAKFHPEMDRRGDRFCNTVLASILYDCPLSEMEFQK